MTDTLEIRVLGPDISNKIAAGEVVERPASVVKELIENAVDAETRIITIEIRKGGLEYIRVTDNGKGIPQSDVETAFLRHATSKLATEADLERIGTLGFRGEALASIAAVSRVSLLTKRAEEDGVCLELEAGVVTKKEPAGCPDGTTMVVRDIFFNTPARMKFLKSDRAECGYITDMVERLALSRPDIAIKYIVDGKLKLQTSGDGKLLSCIYSVYGGDYAKNVQEVSYDFEGAKVTGFVGNASVSRGNRGFQSFFVNGRYVKSRTLTAAAEEAYKKRMMTGKFPFFVLSLDIAPELVDINVHPTKLEIKFANEKQAFHAVYFSVKTALEEGKAAMPEEEINTSASKPQITRVVEQVSFRSSQLVDKGMNLREAVRPILTGEVMMQPAVESSAPIFPVVERKVVPLERELVQEKSEEENEVHEKPEYRIVGQAFSTYIIIETQDEITFIDQHAAHERQIYEDLVKNRVNPQRLLVPENVVLTKPEVDLLIENIEIFEDMGFEIDQFSDSTVMIRQTPVELPLGQLRDLVIEVLDKLNVGNRAPGLECRERAMYTVACKAAVKANKTLTDQEINPLVDWVLEENGIDTCPHGRPLCYSVKKSGVEKWFKRI